MSKFRGAMQHIIDCRGGKLRVPGLEPPVIYYVAVDVWQDALATGYITEDGAVTGKFIAEYGDMFDKIGKIL